MRKFIAILTALCLMLVPAMSLADDVSSSYFWSTGTEFDLYDLGFSINIPENWTRADDETIAAMNGEGEDAQAADDTTDNATVVFSPAPSFTSYVCVSFSQPHSATSETASSICAAASE